MVIPCRAMWDTVARAIASADSADEIIVVCDERWSPTVPRLYPNGTEDFQQFFTDAWGGVCYARNAGIANARYELIVPLDADDELLPEGLQDFMEAWKPGTLVYGGWIENGEYKSPPPPEMLRVKNVAHATWLFHKDDWQRVGGYDPDFNIGGEDWAFMVALVAAGVKAVRIDRPILKRTVRSGSRTDQARSRIHFIRQLLIEKYPGVMR